jgi:hypothetical protein
MPVGKYSVVEKSPHRTLAVGSNGRVVEWAVHILRPFSPSTDWLSQLFCARSLRHVTWDSMVEIIARDDLPKRVILATSRFIGQAWIAIVNPHRLSTIRVPEGFCGLGVGERLSQSKDVLHEITRFIAALAGCAFTAPELRVRVRQSFLEVQCFQLRRIVFISRSQFP